MKRTFLLLVYCLVFFPFLNAQDDSNNNTTTEIEPTKINITQEVGLNGTFFLKQVISLSDTTLSVSPYLLTYKLMFNKIGLRIGLGGTYKKEKQSDEDFADNTSLIESSIDARLGFEYQKQFHPRWTVAAGLDFLYQNAGSKFVADTGFDVATVEDKISGFGAGPVLGIYFHLNKNLSLYTEGAFYFLSNKEEKSNRFTNFPQFNDTENTIEITEFKTYLPATLYVVFRF